MFLDRFSLNYTSLAVNLGTKLVSVDKNIIQLIQQHHIQQISFVKNKKVLWYCIHNIIMALAM